MRKGIIQKLTMLAFVAMVGIPAFAQGGKFGTNAGVATTIGEGHVAGDVFDLEELQYRVIDTQTGLNLEVIGFASYISGATGTGDPTLLESKYAGTVTIPHYLDPADVGVGARDSSVAANAFTTTVLYPTNKGQSTDSKDQFAAAAAKVTKLEIDYSPTELTAAIGANAFEGLPSLTQVENFTPGNKVLDIPVSAFTNINYNNCTLSIPSGDDTVRAYASKTGWSRFIIITNGSIILGDLTDDGMIDIDDLDAFLDLMDTNPESVLGDFDGNGDIDIDDLDILLDKIVGYSD